MNGLRLLALVIALLMIAVQASSQVPQKGVLKLGGFRCIDLRDKANDNYLDLYQTAYWSNASFRMDVWKRMGVPYWYSEGAGNIRVAGRNWKRPFDDIVSASTVGGKAQADAQQEGNGAIRFANDGDPFSYWYAGDKHPSGKLWIEFPKPQRVKEVRFLGWATPRHAPKDYTVGLILPDGSRKELARIKDEKRMGEWIGFAVDNLEIKGIYLDVETTMEGEHGPVIFEFQARGEQTIASKAYPRESTISLQGIKAKSVHFLGNVGGGFDTHPDVETPVGEYVFTYENGQTEAIPLIGGKNVAPTLYGHFVPEAQVAWALRDREAMMDPLSAKLNYHLDDLVEVEPKRQLMVFEHKLGHPDWPLKQVAFRCTNDQAFLILQGLTLSTDGQKMNALVYNGKRLSPTPKSAPSGSPSWLEKSRDPSKTVSLDGNWEYRTDPGNQGIRRQWFDLSNNVGKWGQMRVPSQWYVEGLDYHVVVWYRRTFTVPQTLTEKTLELVFDRVDYDARVWINGIYIGRHIGAYASFRLDATKAILRNEPNVLVVRVDSPLDPGFAGYKTLAKGNAMDDIAMPYAEEGSMGGIYRSVRLVGRGEASISDVWASSEVATNLAQANVKVQGNVIGSGTLLVKCKLSEPRDGSKKSRVFESSQTVSGSNPITFNINVEKPKLWYPWEQGKPNLYTLEVEVWQGTERLDRKVSRVGIKQVDFNAAESCIYLNHHRLFLKGMLYDDNHWQSMMDRRDYRYRIQLQKDAGLNVIRLTTHQSSPEFYELCDEMGMMVWQEMPLQWSYSGAAGIHGDILGIVSETMKQTRSHASVLGYSAWNEGGQYGFTEEVTKLMKSLDSTRPMTRASGGGDFDVHVYPTQWRSLTRRTPLWSGLTFGFISETGAYGISDLKNLKEMFGDDLFKYDGAEYFWETFASYRHIDGPAYMESPSPIEWPTEKIKKYVFDRVDASERFFWQAMKSMFEVTRAQRFAPTTSCIYCRFDDPFPTAFLGVVNFIGRPLKVYSGLKEACQPVVPILMFDSQSASDVRVINEHWFESWKNCKLRYILKSKSGKVVTSVEKVFDLPADSVIKVLNRKECGDLWHLTEGFDVEITLTSQEGKVIGRNSYNLNAEEVKTFTTCVYPVAPVVPVDTLISKVSDAKLNGPIEKQPIANGYGVYLALVGGTDQTDQKPSIEFQIDVSAAGDYAIRPACDSGANLHAYSLYVDGVKAPLESFLWLDMNLTLSRSTYGPSNLSWFPGWTATLAKGTRKVELRWEGEGAPPKLILDAIGVQRR